MTFLIELLMSPTRGLTNTNSLILQSLVYLITLTVAAFVYVKLKKVIQHNVKEFYPDKRLNIKGNLRG